jgi:hypothetical protein
MKNQKTIIELLERMTDHIDTFLIMIAKEPDIKKVNFQIDYHHALLKEDMRLLARIKAQFKIKLKNYENKNLNHDPDAADQHHHDPNDHSTERSDDGAGTFLQERQDGQTSSQGKCQELGEVRQENNESTS